MRVDSRELPLSAISLCQLLPCHLGPPKLSINLYHRLSQAVLTAPLERSMCPYQLKLLSFRIRSRSSMPSCASSSLDLIVTISCSLTLQICLLIALSFRCRRWSFVNGLVSLAWSTQELYTRTSFFKERWQEEITGSSSLNFFQTVSHVLKVHSHWLLRACFLGRKMKLPPPACQVRLGPPSVVYRPRGVQFPGTLYICRGGSNEHPQSMFLNRNKKNNVCPSKPQFYYIKLGFKGIKIIYVCFRNDKVNRF